MTNSAYYCRPQSAGGVGVWVPSDRAEGGRRCLSGVNSAVEEPRVKLRFAGASCRSEEPWSNGCHGFQETNGGEESPCRWASGWINRNNTFLLVYTNTLLIQNRLTHVFISGRSSCSHRHHQQTEQTLQSPRVELMRSQEKKNFTLDAYFLTFQWLLWATHCYVHIYWDIGRISTVLSLYTTTMDLK